MPETTRIESARLVFAKVTGALEDAAVAAAEGQASPNLSAARQSCDCLIAQLKSSLTRLQRLRRRLG